VECKPDNFHPENDPNLPVEESDQPTEEYNSSFVDYGQGEGQAARRWAKLTESQILAQYTPDQKKELGEKRGVLSSLAYFIGKDFTIPVDFNQPKTGWHWDATNNVIRIDPEDVLHKPMDYLRFVIAHEGGHRRITRSEFIPPETWSQPGFGFMMNAIEDCRMNNFVAESYPKFREDMNFAYDLDLEMAAEQRAKAELGHVPKSIQAGLEFIKRWYGETVADAKIPGDSTIPAEVTSMVDATLLDARESWLTYPSRQEADKGEKPITRYAKKSYEINRDKIWPEFKKLVDEDTKDQASQQALQDMQRQDQPQTGEGGQSSIPSELKDKLTPQEEQELRDALDQAKQKNQQQQNQPSENQPQDNKPEGQPPNEPTPQSQEGSGEQGESNEPVGEGDAEQSQLTSENQPSEGKGKPIDMDQLSDSTKQKIREYVESLPQETRQNLARRAEEAIQQLEKELAKELQGKLVQNPEERLEASSHKKSESTDTQISDQESRPESDAKKRELTQDEIEQIQQYRETLERLMTENRTDYESYREEVLPIIDQLEQDLREIFVRRRAQKWETGFKTGKRVDIKRRIQEKAKEVPAVESNAWQRREMPTEKDYAITLLVDLSGSMRGGKIAETFKAVVVLSEVLNRLSINTEILGFNDVIREYQEFGQQMSRDVRESMTQMPLEVLDDQHARYNDDGWALGQASERLAHQKASEKFLIVLSDGTPEESSAHSGRQYDLRRVINRIGSETDQKLVGLGVGQGTDHVESYYPNSMANVSVGEMADKMADLLREIIDNGQNF